MQTLTKLYWFASSLLLLSCLLATMQNQHIIRRMERSEIRRVTVQSAIDLIVQSERHETPEEVKAIILRAMQEAGLPQRGVAVERFFDDRVGVEWGLWFWILEP